MEIKIANEPYTTKARRLIKTFELFCMNSTSISTFDNAITFGFSLLTDAEIGCRKNDLTEAMPYLKKILSDTAYRALTFSTATEEFLTAAKRTEYSQF